DLWPEHWSKLGGDDIALAQQASLSQEKPAAPLEKYDCLTRYGTQILCLFTPEAGCHYLSANFCRLTGQEEQLGEAFFDLVAPDHRPRLRELLANLIPGGEPQKIRLSFRHGDGQHYWYQMTFHVEDAQ